MEEQYSDFEEQGEEQHSLLSSPLSMTKTQLLLTGVPIVATGVLEVASHFNFGGLLLGGFITLAVARHSQDILHYLVPGSDVAHVAGVTERVVDAISPMHEQDDDQAVFSKLKRLVGIDPSRKDPVLKSGNDVQHAGDITEPLQPELPQEVDAFQAAVHVEKPLSIARLTIADIVAHTERNSYMVYIGRSLTKPRSPAVPIRFYKRHIKLIGASQHGKSSMAAAMLETILRTHDPKCVEIALLDMEDTTSRLFANVPHIARVMIGEKQVRLHARSPEQVLEHLRYICALIDYRYPLLATGEIEQQPLLLVYLEEFIELKDYFKSRIDQVGKDEKEQAKQDYAFLVFSIKKIARRGLKVLVQLLMCAQVDYRDEDLQEALVNVTSGMCFAVRPSAAQAAGFVMTDLLNRNYRDDQKGQAVVEMPDCKDLVLAPDYNLEKRLEAQRSKATTQEQARRFAKRPTEPLRVMREQMAFRTQAPGHSSLSPSSSFSPGSVSSEREKQNEDEDVNEDEGDVNELQKPYERDEHVISSKQGDGETFITPMNEHKYTSEQEIAILNASFQLMRESGKITRSDIMERLNWTRAQWGAIKAVCDKHNIAKQ